MKTVEPKYYLNKKLKPEIPNHYKVYMRFNLNGVNHRVKSQVINYLDNEDKFELLKDSFKKEANYINSLINFSSHDYFFGFYEEDFSRLDSDLYIIYVEEIQSYNKLDPDNYIKPVLMYRDQYRKELIDYLESKSKIESDILGHLLLENLFEHKIKYPLDFVKEDNIRSFITSCNDLLIFTNENKTNIYKWVFNGHWKMFKEKYSVESFELINTFVLHVCHDIFLQTNILEMLNNEK